MGLVRLGSIVGINGEVRMGLIVGINGEERMGLIVEGVQKLSAKSI